MYGLTAPPWIGPGPDDRDLDRDVLEVLGPRAAQRLHLRPALDLEDAGRIGVLDALVRGRVVVGDPREVDPLAARARRSSPRTARPPRASPARAGRSSESRRPSRSPCPTGRSGGPPSPRARSGSSRSAAGWRRSSRPSAGRDGAAARAPRPPAREPAQRPAGPGSALRPAPLPADPNALSMSLATSRASHPSLPRATRSISPGGSPSALPSSRIAPRAR